MVHVRAAAEIWRIAASVERQTAQFATNLPYRSVTDALAPITVLSAQFATILGLNH
jgi:hypothetical protein